MTMPGRGGAAQGAAVRLRPEAGGFCFAGRRRGGLNASSERFDQVQLFHLVQLIEVRCLYPCYGCAACGRQSARRLQSAGGSPRRSGHRRRLRPSAPRHDEDAVERRGPRLAVRPRDRHVASGRPQQHAQRLALRNLDHVDRDGSVREPAGVDEARAPLPLPRVENRRKRRVARGNRHAPGAERHLRRLSHPRGMPPPAPPAATRSVRAAVLVVIIWLPGAVSIRLAGPLTSQNGN